MPESDPIKSAGRLIRSILPAKTAHLLLLVGSTFLFISPGLRWWPLPSQLSSDYWTTLREWAGTIRIVSLPILVAGAAGYFVSLRRVGRPIRCLIVWVLLPALGGVLAILSVANLLYRRAPDSSDSIFSSGGDVFLSRARAVFHVAVDSGPGLSVAATGMALLIIFVALAHRGRVNLPVSLLPWAKCPSPESAANRPDDRTMRFIWMMIALVPLTQIPDYLLVILLSLANYYPAWAAWPLEAVGASTFALFVLWALGSDWKRVVRKSLHLPPPRYFAFGMLFPAAVANAWPFYSYLRDRVHWAVYAWGKYGFPRLESYFGLPDVGSLWYLATALIEEIAWRGYLQPRFIRRYGFLRGIFLVGIVWGAFHFSGDFHPSQSYIGVSLTLANRLVGTVAFSYALAWMTIRSRSILPAAVAHGVLDMFGVGSVPVSTPFSLLVTLWAILGYVLFRFWPPVLAPEPTDSNSLAGPEAAT